MNILLYFQSAISARIKLLLLGLMLSLSAHAYADEGTVCAPFKDAQVDQSMLTMMLKAAKDGDLYRIKPGSSKMGFCVNSPVGVVKAEFLDFKGGLALKGANKQGGVMIHIAADSLEADSFIIEAMLKGESFFDSELFPSILFVSTGFEWITDNKGVFKGDLTMRGVTKTVAFYVELKKTQTEQGEELVTVKANTTIQRSEFNMYTLSPMVDDRVSLCMTIDAYKHRS